MHIFELHCCLGNILTSLLSSSFFSQYPMYSGMPAYCLGSPTLLALSQEYLHQLQWVILPMMWVAFTLHCSYIFKQYLNLRITHFTVTNTFPYNTTFFLKHSLMGWRKVFYLSAGLNVFGALHYILFGTGKIQTWARRENQSETETER